LAYDQNGHVVAWKAPLVQQHSRLRKETALIAASGSTPFCTLALLQAC